jgi:hypothetical protein
MYCRYTVPGVVRHFRVRYSPAGGAYCGAGDPIVSDDESELVPIQHIRWNYCSRTYQRIKYWNGPSGLCVQQSRNNP